MKPILFGTDGWRAQKQAKRLGKDVAAAGQGTQQPPGQWQRCQREELNDQPKAKDVDHEAVYCLA